MKALVGFAFFLLFLAGIAFVMLQGRQLAQQNLPGGGAGLTANAWRPVEVAGETIPDDAGLLVNFEVDGSITGNGGCNQFFGTLEQSDSGISVGPLGSTRMACPEPIMRRETAFLEALQETRGFSLQADGMSILDEDGNVLASFVPRDAV